MSHHAHQVDTASPEFAQAVKDLYLVRIDMSGVGIKGVPDWCLGINDGYEQVNELVELKTPGKHPSDEQILFARGWTGRPIRLVYTLDELLVLAGRQRGTPPRLLREYPTKEEREMIKGMS